MRTHSAPHEQQRKYMYISIANKLVKRKSTLCLAKGYTVLGLLQATQLWVLVTSFCAIYDLCHKAGGSPGHKLECFIWRVGAPVYLTPWLLRLVYSRGLGAVSAHLLADDSTCVQHGGKGCAGGMMA